MFIKDKTRLPIIINSDTSVHSVLTQLIQALGMVKKPYHIILHSENMINQFASSLVV